jgi:hypothetical protein
VELDVPLELELDPLLLQPPAMPELEEPPVWLAAEAARV